MTCLFKRRMGRIRNMNAYEYISIYNGSVALITIAIVMIVFLTWQLRWRRRQKRTISEK